MNILLIKTSALGDILHLFPVVDYLKQRCPRCTIDWVVEQEGVALVQAHPGVDTVLPMATRVWRRAPLSRGTRHSLGAALQHLRRKRYDVIFDLQGNCKSAAVLCAARGKVRVGFGMRSVAEWPNLLCTGFKVNPPGDMNIREEYLAVVKAFFLDATPAEQPQPVALRLTDAQEAYLDQLPAQAILVCPGAAWPNKQLPYEEWLVVLGQLPVTTPLLFAWGSPKERAFALALSAHCPGSKVLPLLELPLLQRLMAKSQLVVAMDSLPLHLCATTNTPTLSFFGPSLGAKYAPQGPQHHVVQGACPYGVVFAKRCPRLRTCPTGACMHTTANMTLHQGE